MASYRPVVGGSFVGRIPSVARHFRGRFPGECYHRWNRDLEHEAIATFKRGAGLRDILLVLSLLVLVAQIVFREWWTPFAVRYQLKYLTLLPLLWVAFPFKQHGASLASIVVSAIALAGALRQVGGAGPERVTPFASRLHGDDHGYRAAPGGGSR